MGRSVARPQDRGTITFYMTTPIFIDDLPPEASDDNDAIDYYDWSDFLENVTTIILDAYPSFQSFRTRIFIGNEIRVLMENNHGCVTISEYCGITAICLVPRRDALAQHWVEQIERNFRALLTKAFPSQALHSMGTASNGEQFFKPANRPEGVITSKEGVLW